MLAFILVPLLLPCLAPLASALSLAPSSLDTRGHHSNSDRKGAVASESSICSQIGIDLLRDGGNAADAVRFRLYSPKSRRAMI